MTIIDDIRRSCRAVLKHVNVFIAIFPSLVASACANEHVILLHGLCRTRRSMNSMESTLTKAGYQVANVGYPSRSASIAELSEQAIGNAVADCRQRGATTMHFVTHSMGGILVRSYLSRHAMPDLGRVVMLAPPNQGSEVVDRLGRWRLFATVNGPAGRELGTDDASTPNRLGPFHGSLGIIAGRRSWNWLNSCIIPGADDGKVSVTRTKLAGMTDHLVIAASHPFIASNRGAREQTLHFLRHGKFARTFREPVFSK